MFSRLSFLVILLTALALGGVACGDGPKSRVPQNPLPADPAATAQTIRIITPQPPALPKPPAAPAAVVVPPPVTPPEAVPAPVPTRPAIVRPSVVPPRRATGYLVSAPAALRSGYSEGVSVSLFSAQNTPASGEVRLSLTRAGAPIASAAEYVEGAQTVFLNLPLTESGDDYALEVSGPGFEDSTPMRVIDGAIVFVETDKPIYKPGQDMRVRVLRLDADLRPMPGEVTVEITDAKGIKVFKKQTTSDDYGMASLTMPLSTEPNLGVWKVTAHYGEQTAQVDPRVERYTLPRYEIDVTLPRDWVLTDDPIEGVISAEYSFGKPVRGEVEVVAYRYVGTWERFASFSEDIDGEVSFDLPAVQYVAGVPAAGGQGNVRLDITVSERSTGYVEETTHLLTVAPHPVSVRLIAESPSFKPSLPFSILVIAETPDNMPVDTDVLLHISYYGENLDYILDESLDVPTINGKVLVSIEPPKDAVKADVYTDYGSSLALNASYSPSDSFIHLEQTGEIDLGVGDVARFTVHATRPDRFYYEIVSRGRVMFSDVSDSADIAFVTAPSMAPSSRLIVYQILPDNEVAADYISFDVSGAYPMETSICASADEARPGESVEIELVTQGRARVGLTAVDRSVFILAENRLNLHQVFAELERLYMRPQVELHIDDQSWPPSTVTRGAKEAFADAGLVIMTNKTVPEGELHQPEEVPEVAIARAVAALAVTAVPAPTAAIPAAESSQPDGQLAEVQRMRQFFPETWLWTDLVTDDSGRAIITAEAPDSITTWMFRAVSLSKEHGLGVAESEMRVFQPFFVEMELPFSAVRSEEFPVKVSLYNYLDSIQEFFVELEDSDDYELLDESLKSVTVEGSDLGVVEFRIRLTRLGSVPIEITARSRDSADAVVRDLLVEPEGVSHEIVENAIMSAGDAAEFVTSPPVGSVPGSARAQVAISGSYLSQTLEGLENLLQMPFGCGEQNMILFAPNVFVARYLEETGQLKPEVMAKAEHLMTTGYQRELTYRRADGSFSAFGDSDDSGSLWLTAFVLKTFAQADGLIYMDDTVLRDAAYWIAQRQRSDGSFEPVGFLHHQELLGGLQGNTALTAYVAIALLEASESDRADSAIAYLEGQLDAIEDPYTMAIVTYALELGGSGMAGAAYDRLMSIARQDENGIYWGDDTSSTLPANGQMSNSAGVETTGYATLALLERGDGIGAASAARWLVSQRNAFGGFGSTQDTVVGLQALIEFAAQARFDVDMTITLTSGAWSRQIEVNAANSDVVQIIDVPIGEPLRVVASKGDGEAVVQVVNRFNMPEVETHQVEAFRIDVDYSADDIEVDDRIEVSVEARFTPPMTVDAGMVVIDVAIPTGFAPVTETVEALVVEHHKLKRYEIAGRKVILYIEDMRPDESISLEFEAVALHPVQAQPVTSQVYSYYSPHWRAETLGQAVSVGPR